MDDGPISRVVSNLVILHEEFRNRHIREIIVRNRRKSNTEKIVYFCFSLSYATLRSCQILFHLFIKHSRNLSKIMLLSCKILFTLFLCG
jgi:hypothetical protein